MNFLGREPGCRYCKRRFVEFDPEDEDVCQDCSEEQDQEED